MVTAVNLVGGGDINRELDVDVLADDIAAQVHNVEQKQSGLYLNISEKSPLIMLYRSGKYVITGATKEIEAKSTLEDLCSELFRLGINVDPSFSVYNIVFQSSIPYQIDLEKLLMILGLENSEYEPEQSPFLVYRPEDYECVITIANSGKCVINGVTDSATANEAIEHIKSMIDEEQLEHL